jgi:cell division FtsZ-interacting protein ZapD
MLLLLLLGLFPHDSVKAVLVATIPPPSPRCCYDPVFKFCHHVQQDQRSSDAQAMCSVMPEEQQKALALKIARCRLQDLGIPQCSQREMAATLPIR